jgi:hypothetical protein
VVERPAEILGRAQMRAGPGLVLLPL